MLAYILLIHTASEQPLFSCPSMYCSGRKVHGSPELHSAFRVIHQETEGMLPAEAGAIHV